MTIGPDGHIYAGSDNGFLYSLDTSGQLRYKFKTNMMIWSSPVFSPHKPWLLFGSLNRNIYLLDRRTGEAWDVFKARGEVKSSPTYSLENGREFIYVGDSNGSLIKLEVVPKGGKAELRKAWEHKVNAEIYSSPVAKNDDVYFGSLNGKFYSLSSQGKVKWIYDTFSRISSSPLITKDDVIVFGAKNSKLYALDARTGERIWSYRTAEENVKVNLDASPVMTPEGVIVNGSYSGKVHFVPFEYCLQNREDRHCEFGGLKDIPDFVAGLEDGTYFLHETREGRILKDEIPEISPSQPLRLKFVVIKKGQYLPNAAINPLGFKVRVEGDEVDYRISSNGEYLNILPTPFFRHGQRTRISIQGSYYLKTHWLLDRFKYFGLGKVRGQVNFDVSEAESAEENPIFSIMENDKSLAIHSMYMFQPETLDTYIPAALDGQNFLIKFLFHNPNDQSFWALSLPAIHSNGKYQVMPWPSKVFLLKGTYKGQISKGNS